MSLKNPLREGILKRIHVNMWAIKANKKAGDNKLPVLTIKTSTANTKAHKIDILGESKMVYSPEKPLACGAVVWMETKAEVFIVK